MLEIDFKKRISQHNKYFIFMTNIVPSLPNSMTQSFPFALKHKFRLDLWITVGYEMFNFIGKITRDKYKFIDAGINQVVNNMSKNRFPPYGNQGSIGYLLLGSD